MSEATFFLFKALQARIPAISSLKLPYPPQFARKASKEIFFTITIIWKKDNKNNNGLNSNKKTFIKKISDEIELNE